MMPVHVPGTPRLLTPAVTDCAGPLFLAYTIDDDGVHAMCGGCPFDYLLGMDAWIPEAQEAERAHAAATPLTEDQEDQEFTP